MKKTALAMCAAATVAIGLGGTAAQASPTVSDSVSLRTASGLVQKADWDDRGRRWWWGHRGDRDRRDRWDRGDRGDRRADRNDHWRHRDRDDRRDWR
jgi:hypothetical protein